MVRLRGAWLEPQVATPPAADGRLAELEARVAAAEARAADAEARLAAAEKGPG